MKRTLTSCFGLLAIVLGLIAWIASISESHTENKGLDLINAGNNLIHSQDTASLQSAAEDYRKAAAIFHGMDSREDHNQGVAYYDLAIACHKMKQDTQAIDAALKALPLLHDNDAKTDKANTLSNLGEYYILTNQEDKAMDVYKQAEALYKELGKTEDVQKVVKVEQAILEDAKSNSQK